MTPFEEFTENIQNFINNFLNNFVKGNKQIESELFKKIAFKEQYNFCLVMYGEVFTKIDGKTGERTIIDPEKIEVPK